MTFTVNKYGSAFALKAADWVGKEREDFYVNIIRGFQANENYLVKYRLNPCAALLAFIN